MGEAKYSAACPFIVSLVALCSLFAIYWTFPKDSRAEGLSGYLEYDYTKNDTDFVIAGGQSNRTKSNTLTQLYNISLDKRIYPNLNLITSGIFRRLDTSTEIEGEAFETSTTTLRPFINLTLRTPLYSADANYSRNEEKVNPSVAPSVTTVRESINTNVFWKPDRFPDLKLSYSRDHLYDKSRSSVDTTTDLYELTSRYRPVDPLYLYYRGTFRNTESQLSGATLKETLHNGQVDYSNNWWQRRITFSTSYNITNQDAKIETTGGGEVSLPVFPFAGLSALSDSPVNILLTSNPALIDQNLAASAGINLGLPLPGGDTRLRNMGLDFFVAKEINTLFVWIDRDVAQVADAFSWRIYTSSDNQNWDLRETVSSAIYSPTFNRFEILFSKVNARYVKVVTSPLTPAVPFALSFPTIFVTELQSELRRPASEVGEKVTSTSQRGFLDFRAVILESLNLTYEFAYIFTKTDLEELIYTVSNGLSFFRQFNKTFSGNGRVSFENGVEKAGNREALLASASIAAVPINTVFQSLTFSGKDESIAGKRNSNVSILLYNTARLYEGISADLGGGMSFQENDEGKKIRTSQFNTAATFVPNRKMNLTIQYNETATDTSGGDLQEETTTSTRTAEADLSVTPVPTVYLFGSYRVETSPTLPRRNILNYSLNWSPFPDGTLHLTFYYNEIVRSDETKEKSIIPSMRWYFNPRMYLNFSYQYLKSEAPVQTTTSNVYSGTVRISF